MANSNRRIKNYNTVHHVTSRIAHRVFFLKEEERNDFFNMMCRIADFSGIQLVGWCLMENHFHLLAYLPQPPMQIDENEVLRRIEQLKGTEGRKVLEQRIACLRAEGETGEGQIRLELDKIIGKMYNVGMFMKILKQWFTMDYNSRNSHKGTMWESTYHDRVIASLDSEEARDCLGYINLNPVRAAITCEFSDYPWSSLTAASNGNQRAIAGLRLAYGDKLADEEIISLHKERMARLLEAEKMKRAIEIAQKRAVGFDMPCDALTNEALVAQAEAHLKMVQDSMLELQLQKNMTRSDRIKDIERRINSILAVEPNISAPMLAGRVGLATSTVYRYLRKVKMIK